MSRTWITDIRHYLDDDGELPIGIPAAAAHFALFQGAIVSWVTNPCTKADPATNVPCFRRRGKPLCTEEVEALLEPGGGSIAWKCPVCGDRGVISGWQGTRWDRGGSQGPRRPNKPMQRTAFGRR